MRGSHKLVAALPRAAGRPRLEGRGALGLQAETRARTRTHARAPSPPRARTRARALAPTRARAPTQAHTCTHPRARTHMHARAPAPRSPGVLIRRRGSRARRIQPCRRAVPGRAPPGCPQGLPAVTRAVCGPHARLGPAPGSPPGGGGGEGGLWAAGRPTDRLQRCSPKTRVSRNESESHGRARLGLSVPKAEPGGKARGRGFSWQRIPESSEGARGARQEGRTGLARSPSARSGGGQQGAVLPQPGSRGVLTPGQLWARSVPVPGSWWRSTGSTGQQVRRRLGWVAAARGAA